MKRTAKKSDLLADPKRQAAWFGHVRAAHQTETAEDYVELIADLIEAQGEARIVDLARRFGISHATVNKTIARLQRDGFVKTEPYRALFLTPKGRALAKSCKARHILIVEFLKTIGVSANTAEFDAEGVEHHVSAETLKAFERFVKKHSRQ